MKPFNKIFKNILFFCRGFAIFLPYKRIEQMSLVKKVFYSYWIASEFKSFGDKSFITDPIDIKGGKCIEIGKNFSIGKNSIINDWEKYQNDNYSPKIIIGNNVLTGRKVTIIDNSHGDSSIESFDKPPAKRRLSSKGQIIIGDKVTILSVVTIGLNSIIGAN